MGTTTNNGWPTPVATDLVKDGWEAIKDLGDAIDTTLGVYSPATPMGVHLSTVTFSGVSSQSLPANTFTATYSNYLIQAQYTSTASNQIDFRFRTSGTDNSTSNYQKFRWDGRGNSVSVATAQNVGTIGQNTNGQDTSFIADIVNPFQTKYTQWYSKGHQLNDTSANPYDWRGNFNGTTSFDSLTLLPAAGTLTGTIVVYAYNL
jgi:hypothetical protein